LEKVTILLLIVHPFATAGYFYDTFAYEICSYGIYFYRISFYGKYFYKALNRIPGQLLRMCELAR
jgi:hypothetical protein